MLSLNAFASALAHAGLGVVALGVAGTTVWRSEAIQVLEPGQSMTVGGYTLRLNGTERFDGPNYLGQRASIAVTSGGRAITTLAPEKRQFPVEQMTTSETAIRTTGLSDLYVVLGDPRGKGWVVRVYVNPLAPLIWIGGLFMAIGGFFAVASRARKALSARIRVPAAPGLRP
jgi:cytochrome c-type biogenesis protein CcmF